MNTPSEVPNNNVLIVHTTIIIMIGFLFFKLIPCGCFVKPTLCASSSSPLDHFFVFRRIMLVISGNLVGGSYRKTYLLCTLCENNNPLTVGVILFPLEGKECNRAGSPGLVYLMKLTITRSCLKG